jgi:hypothetical protein
MEPTPPEIDRQLLNEVWRAVQKAIAVAILIGVHWGLQRLLKVSFGDFAQYAKVEYFASVAALLAFLLIYGRLLFEMVTIFVALPSFQKRSSVKESPQK